MEYSPILVSYDDGDGKDIPACVCMQMESEGNNTSFHMISGYVGNDATNLFEVVSKQGGMKELRKKIVSDIMRNFANLIMNSSEESLSDTKELVKTMFEAAEQTKEGKNA